MGIISLNEKRTAEKPKLTTGKEVSYFAADQFEFPLATPKITGHYYWRAGLQNNGAFGVFWEDSSGNISDLTFESTSSPTFNSNERTTATHSSYTSAWSDFEVDLTGKSNGRPVFYVRRGTTYEYVLDVCFDDFAFTSQNATTIDLDPSVESIRNAGYWMKSSKDETATTYTEAKTNYNDVTLSTIPNSHSHTELVFNFHQADTPSNYTGPDNAADNNNSTYYLYYEATSNGYNNAVGYLTWKAYRNVITGAEL